MNRVASEAVMTALGVPAPPGGFAWHERDALVELFAPHGFAVEVEEHGLVFRAASVDEYLETEQRNHPVAIRGMAILEQLGRVDELQDRLRRILASANEDPSSFRVTSPYVVATLWRRDGGSEPGST